MVVVLSVLAGAATADDDRAKRQACLEEIRRVLPQDSAWEKWFEETGELPPDFDAMPSMQSLPDPLNTEDGTRITTIDAWGTQREYLTGLLKHWVIGTVPPSPDNVEVEVLSEREETGAIVREVRLTFGPGRKANLWLELLIPKSGGPFPVFMTQENHRMWAMIALRRGYIGCVYAGCDSRDDTDSFVEAYPEHDWSRLTRRAWAASRCIDHLEHVPEADTSRIALTGHSRNGKLSLIGSALDERIAVVISSSSGAGGCQSARYFSEAQFGEGIELLTRRFPDWFHPRFRFFTGREDRLPVDLHTLVALSAPRPCLLSIALNDPVEDTWAMQQTYLAVKPVYQLYDAEDSLRIFSRPASHETWPTIVERYLDWCDVHFADRPTADFPERLIHPWDWDSWSEGHSAPDATSIDLASVSGKKEWAGKRDEIRDAIRTVLGTPPPGAINMGSSYGSEPDHIEQLLGRSGSAGRGVVRQDVMLGEYINGDMYVPKTLVDAGEPGPALLWLHPACTSKGYVPAYRRGDAPYNTLSKAGYPVFCYDQIGYGRRIEEVEGFYDRYPDWSLLGQMVRDAQAALDTMATLPYVDPEQIYVVGYSLGAVVALHLCALDDRPAGLVSVCGPQPFRTDGGVAHWGRTSMLAPALGFFEGRESAVPYDLEDLLACMAPKPVCVISPTLDREARLEDVTHAVDQARKVYGLFRAKRRLVQQSPEAYNHFDPATQQLVVDWLETACEK